MPTTIVFKHSHTADAEPSTVDIQEGEIAINTADGVIFTRDNNNNIVTLGGIYDGSSLPNADPGVSGALWNDSGTVKVSAG
jgi:hypothetical protein